MRRWRVVLLAGGASVLAACGANGAGQEGAGSNPGPGGSGGSGGDAGRNAGGARGSPAAGAGGTLPRDASTGGDAGTQSDASIGGDAQAPVVVDCIAGGNVTAIAAGVRATYRGDNGTFTSQCNAAGNLLNYSCELVQVCSSPTQPNGCVASQWHETGQVVSGVIDCNGRCMDGSCVFRCAAPGDVLVYRAVDPSGAVTFENETDHRIYACASISYDNANDSYDCKSAAVGQEVIVDFLAVSGQCAGGTFGSLIVGRTANTQECGYSSCRFAD